MSVPVGVAFRFGSIHLSRPREKVSRWNKQDLVSQPFVDPAKPQGGYFAEFLAQLTKVRVPTGEGAITKAGRCCKAIGLGFAGNSMLSGRELPRRRESL